MKKMRYALMVLVCGLQAQTKYVPGVTYQKDNPNYPQRNPFYFEGKVTWELLKIETPANAWDFVQRGIHKQDDLEDLAGAQDDYRKAISMNSLENGTCQLVSLKQGDLAPNLAFDPAPCMFTVRQRLANLIVKDDPGGAIQLYQEILQIDPQRLEINALMSIAYVSQAAASDDPEPFYRQAIAAFQAELALSPVTAQYTKLTGDEANNAHVHWSLAEIYHKLGQSNDEAKELDLYLKATKWHSDTYPWRIELAKKRLAGL